VPGQGNSRWSGIDLPQGPEIASMTGAEKSSIHHIHQAAQVSAFQADYPIF
jgi:hypothetical protein